MKTRSLMQQACDEVASAKRVRRPPTFKKFQRTRDRKYWSWVLEHTRGNMTKAGMVAGVSSRDVLYHVHKHGLEGKVVDIRRREKGRLGRGETPLKGPGSSVEE